MTAATAPATTAASAKTGASATTGAPTKAGCTHSAAHVVAVLAGDAVAELGPTGAGSR